MPTTALPALQARSRKSLERLLKATIEILNKDGLEGATIPRIAARAELSPGTVYRRFPDKDALLREVCVRLLEQSDLQRHELLKPERWTGVTLANMVRCFIEITLKGYADNRRLLRALSLFTLQHRDAAFVRKVSDLQWKGVREVADFLLTRRDEIDHPDPDAAVRFALLTVGLMAQRVLVLPAKPTDFLRLLPDAEKQLASELPTMFLRYLGIEDEDRN